MQIDAPALELNTEMPSQDFSLLVEEDLTKHLAHENNGVSCGLQKFEIKAFRITSKNNGIITGITAESIVKGPVGECESTATYVCYTDLKNIDGAWQATGSICTYDIKKPI